MNLSQWNQRSATIEQERRFQRTITLHTLTDSWTKSLTPNLDKPYQIERMAKVTLNQNLWLFEKTRLDDLPLELEKLVGSQTVDSFLNQLNDTVWIIQVSTLENALSQSSKEGELLSMLEKTSWNHGKQYAEQLWKKSDFSELELAYQAFIEGHPYDSNAFIEERQSSTELSFLWTRSPLQNKTLKASPVVKHLCKIHEEWIRGFFYSLSRKIKLQTIPTKIMENEITQFTLLWSY
jgi:hypothetical protein